MNPVEQLYDNDPQREWARAVRHRTEFAITQRVLADFLPPAPATIADLGGGPGRYAIPLTQQGYAVTLVDLSQGNLALAQTKAAEAGVELTAVIHANVLSLPRLPADKYDVVLLLGPLYHLLELAERETAVAIAYKLLQPGGLILAAFVTRFAVFRDMAAKGYPDWIATYPERARQILETGQNPAGPDNNFPNSYFAHPDEIKPLMEAAGFETRALIGCEGIVAGHEAHINQLQGELWAQWVDLNYQFSQEPSLYGASDHLLYVGQKEMAVSE